MTRVEYRPSGTRIVAPTRLSAGRIAHEDLLEWLALDLAGGAALADEGGRLVLVVERGLFSAPDVVERAARELRGLVTAFRRDPFTFVPEVVAIAADAREGLERRAWDHGLVLGDDGDAGEAPGPSETRLPTLELRATGLHVRIPAETRALHAPISRAAAAVTLLDLNRELPGARLRLVNPDELGVVAEAWIPTGASEDELASSLEATRSAAEAATRELSPLVFETVAGKVLATHNRVPPRGSRREKTG